MIFLFLFQSNHEIYIQLTGNFLISLDPAGFQMRAFRLAEAFCISLGTLKLPPCAEEFLPSLKRIATLDTDGKYWKCWKYYTINRIFFRFFGDFGKTLLPPWIEPGIGHHQITFIHYAISKYGNLVRN